ncbi:extracellular solute-binding protein, partial [Stenotrophomonas maltophilia]|uniref:extracellular solute-binding protein n=1 Tax=Stenotrophomonas maltophilia TaxID=40324 RepID=UPI003144D847
YWAIIKGSKHVDQAKRFIAFANRPEVQVDYVKQIPYGPTNTLAAANKSPEAAGQASTAGRPRTVDPCHTPPHSPDG